MSMTNLASGKSSDKLAMMPKAELLAWVKNGMRTTEELEVACGRHVEVDRVLASSARSSAALLSKLSHSSDRTTRSRVAANPASAAEDIVRLGQQFPKEFLANPALDLLLLENPALLSEVPSALLFQILRSDRCPEEFLLWAAGLSNEKLQLAVAMNAGTPAEALERLRGSEFEGVREAVTGRLEFPPESLNDPEKTFGEALRARVVSLKRSGRFLEKGSVEEAWLKGDLGLSQWHWLPLGTRGRFSGFRLQYLASLDCLPGKWLELFSRDSDVELRVAVAANPSTPPAVLERLSKDDENRVRREVAENHGTSSVVLEALSVDPDQSVRQSAARPDLWPKLRRSIKAAFHDYQLSSVMELPGLPVSWIESLSMDDDLSIRKAAELVLDRRQSGSMREGVPAEHCDRFYRTLYLQELVDQIEDPASLVTLSELPPVSNPWYGKRFHIQEAVGKCVNTPPDLLAQLGMHDDLAVRKAVASNPTTPKATIQHLFESTPDAIFYLGKNLGASKARQFVLDGLASNPALDETILDRMVRSTSLGTRLALASNPVAPLEWLEKASRDAETRVRASVASNRSLSVRALHKMVHEDQKESVLCAVLENSSAPVEVIQEVCRILFELDPRKSVKYRELFTAASDSLKESIGRGEEFFHCNRDLDRTSVAHRPLAAVMSLSSGPFVGPSRIAKFSRSTDWLVRAAVARNRATSSKILASLRSDPHPLVATLAAAKVEKTPSTGKADIAPSALDNGRIVAEIGLREILAPAMKPSECVDACHAILKGYPSLRETGAYVRYEPVPMSDTNQFWDLLSWWPGLDDGRIGNFRRRHFNLQEGLDIPVEAIASLPEFKSKAFRMAISASPASPVGLLERIASINDAFKPNSGSWSVDQINEGLIKNISTPSAVLGKLWSVYGDRFIYSVVENPNSPVEVLVAIHQKGGKSLMNRLAKNPSAPSEVLQALASDSSEDVGLVRSRVALNPGSNESILSMLSHDNDSYVRAGVAENVATPVSLLEVLAHDGDQSVRQAVAANPNSPVPIVEHLFADIGTWAGAAANHRTPVALLEKLALTTRFDELILLKLNASEHSCEEIVSAMQAVIGMKMAEFDALVLPSSEGKALEAELRRLGGKIESRLLNDDEARSLIQAIRVKLALNPGLPERYISVLAKDPDPRVRAAVLWNKRSPVFGSNILRGLLGLDFLPAAPKKSDLWGCAISTDWLKRLTVALHPEASEEQLSLLSNDDDKDVSRAVRLRTQASALE